MDLKRFLTRKLSIPKTAVYQVPFKVSEHILSFISVGAGQTQPRDRGEFFGWHAQVSLSTFASVILVHNIFEIFQVPELHGKKIEKFLVSRRGTVTKWTFSNMRCGITTPVK